MDKRFLPAFSVKAAAWITAVQAALPWAGAPPVPSCGSDKGGSVVLCPANPAIKPCEELKAEIAAKLDAAGVKSYRLVVVENDRTDGGKVVGSCGNGSKKIVYIKK